MIRFLSDPSMPDFEPNPTPTTPTAGSPPALAHRRSERIRVVLPYHLRNLAGIDGELQLEVQSPVTISVALDAIEARYPVLRGTLRDHDSLRRRPFIRFFAGKEDLSLEPPDTRLPEAVVTGAEPLLVVGAMAGG
jgi:sulfur-carrier protein